MSATTRLDVHLKCDIPACGRSFPYSHAQSIEYVRERAEANGWSFKASYDYCPNHTN